DPVLDHLAARDYSPQLLKPLGVSATANDPLLELPAAAQQRASSIIADQIRHQPFVIFHPGSARVEKFWEPERWAAIIEFATNELGLFPILSGGGTELERAHLTAIGKKLRTTLLDLSGQLDLLSLAVLIERARLLVTVDSAPMHLASAAGTPQVILFGPTNPFHWRPRKSPAQILFDKSPQPLHHFQPREAKRLMKQISTAAVLNAMRLMVSAPAASAV